MRNFNLYEYGHKTTLSASSYNNKVTFETGPDSTIYEFLEGCRILALGISFSERTWKDAIVELAEEYNTENKKKENFYDDFETPEEDI